MLDSPSQKTVLGLRDRAIHSVGLQSGFRRAEIVGLPVGDFHMSWGYESLCVVRKGGKKGSRAMHPQAAQRIRDYRVAAGFFPSLHWDV
jgi:site-specific recombinase XerD